MRKSVIFIGAVLLVICGLFVATSPDKLTMGVIGIMSALVMLGFVFGITPNLQYIAAFRQGVAHLDEMKGDQYRQPLAAPLPDPSLLRSKDHRRDVLRLSREGAGAA